MEVSAVRRQVCPTPLEEPQGHPLPGLKGLLVTATIPILDLDVRLHDANIETESIRLASGALTCRGVLFDLDRRRAVRRRFELRIEDVDAFEIADEAEVGVLPVESVLQHDAGTVEFVGSIPVRLTIKTRTTLCSLITSHTNI